MVLFIKKTTRAISDKVPNAILCLLVLLVVFFTFIFIVFIPFAEPHTGVALQGIETDISLLLGLLLALTFIFFSITLFDVGLRKPARPYPVPFDYLNADTLTKRVGMPIADLKKIYHFTGGNLTLSQDGGAITFSALLNNRELQSASILPWYFSSFPAWSSLGVEFESELPTNNIVRKRCTFTYILQTKNDQPL